MEMAHRLRVQLCWVENCFSFMTADGALGCEQWEGVLGLGSWRKCFISGFEAES